MADDDIAIRLIFFIKSSRQRGISEQAIQAQLVDAGMNEADAARALTLVPVATHSAAFESSRPWQPERGDGTGNIALGVVLLLLGIIITAVTYSSASRGGGHYVVMTGFIVVGILRIVKGLSSR